ncbi:MAG: PorV/PorQ family protein [Syntrophothermus sp.]
MFNKVLILILFFTVAMVPQEFKKTATSGFTFLQIPVNARTAALGETSIALFDMNSDAIFTNPGGLGFTDREHSLSISYAPWIADIKHYAASYSFSSPIGVIGIGAVIFDYGEFVHTAVPSNSTNLYSVLGTYNANALSLGLSYSKRLTDKFSFGVTFKYVKESIYEYKADNILFDGGILYYTGLSSLRIAASISNFGVDSKFINDPIKMPSMLRLGAAMEVIGDFKSDYRLTLSAEAVHPNDNDERLNVGAEFGWQNMVMFRGGYKFFYDEETYSLGIGVNPQLPMPVTLDFAYSDYGRLGDILRLTVQFGL